MAGKRSYYLGQNDKLNPAGSTSKNEFIDSTD